jgi:hypothetical protein
MGQKQEEMSNISGCKQHSKLPQTLFSYGGFSHTHSCKAVTFTSWTVANPDKTPLLVDLSFNAKKGRLLITILPTKKRSIWNKIFG